MGKYENLIEIRNDYNLKQKDIAKYLNKSNTAYNSIENGISRLSIEDAYKLSCLFNVTVDFIVNCTRKKETLSKEKKITYMKFTKITMKEIKSVYKNKEIYNK